MSLRRLLSSISVAWLCSVRVAAALDPSTYSAADPSAPAVTAKNLAASERFWPYQVKLESPWKPEGREAPLASGTMGVLVRVQSAELARIDFGRNGRFEVPVAMTDLVARANQIRLGTLSKPAPHFVHTIGTRLVESGADEIRYVDLSDVYVPKGFLLVFADPNAQGFERLAASLAPLRESEGVMTVLFPQGDQPDVRTREILRAAKWPVNFLRDEYSEGYTRSLRAEGAPIPAAMLVTSEGRVLFDEPWKDGVAASLQGAVKREFGAAGAAASGATSAQPPTRR